MKTKNSPSLVIIALCLAAAGSSSFAQGTIYKQVSPDGSVIYTDKPDSRIKTEKKIQPEFQPSRLSSPGLTTFYSGSAPGAPGTPIAALPPLPGSPVVSAPTPASPTPAAASPAPAQPQTSQTSQTSQGDKADGMTRAQRIEAAQAQYDAAVAAAEAGKAPKGGERNANVNGSSRLNSTYSDRQAKLKSELERAREKLNSVTFSN